MTDHARRRELTAAYRETPRRAGVFLIRNTISGRALVASSLDLDSERHKFDFALSTGSTGVFHRVLVPDVKRLGWSAFELDVVEELPLERERTEARTRDDLATLVALWREKPARAMRGGMPPVGENGSSASFVWIGDNHPCGFWS